MRRLLPPLLLGSLLLTACAGSEGSDDPPLAAASGTPAPAGPTPSATPAQASPPPIEGLVVEAEDPSHTHQEGAIEYDRVPPVGGPHHPRWLACDVYDEAVPLELAVHSLEHGAVWFAHDPDLPSDQVEQLAELAERNEEYVLVAPQEGMDSRIVAVTWGASLEASSADDPRLAQFLEAYAGGGQGGEPGVPCRGNGLTPREARGLLGESA